MRKTMLGEMTRSRNSGARAAAGMEGAMTVVAAVVAELDVVVGREREGRWFGKWRRRFKRRVPRVVAELLSERPSGAGP